MESAYISPFRQQRALIPITLSVYFGEKNETPSFLSQVWITFTNEEFKITLPDQSEILFPNRPGAEKYNYFLFEGEVRIQGIEIK